MGDDERQQIQRLTARAVDRALRSFSERLQATYSDHSAKGRLQSGATIKAAIRLMEESAREAMTGLLADVGEVARDSLAFDQVHETVQSIVQRFGEELVGVVKLASGQGGGRRRTPSGSTPS